MDTKKIIELAHELQGALPFDYDGIKSEEEYRKALALADKLTDSYGDNDAILLDVLWPPIMRYEDTAPEFSKFNESIAKMEEDESERYAKVLVEAVRLFGNERLALRWLKAPVKGLGNKRPIDMLSNDSNAEAVLNIIGRLEHGVFS